MITYDLYLESGPRRRKTMVHVIDLLGCVAVGPTTDDAVAAAPEAIKAYRRFLRRLDEEIDPIAPFATRIVEHVTEGDFIGQGSPYILFSPDREPLSAAEIAILLRRIAGTGEAFAAWFAQQRDEGLDNVPPQGRPAREILRHVLAARGTYLSAPLGSAPGFGRIASAYERGELPYPVAMAESTARIHAIVNAATPEQRVTPRQLPSGPKTLRQALRRILEHDWEHLAELSRRPGGPEL